MTTDIPDGFGPFKFSMGLIEMIGPLVYSFGGRYVDSSGRSSLRDPQNGCLRAAKWLADAVNVNKIV